MPATKAYLRKLQKATNDVIKLLRPEEFPSEAANWADLRCTEAMEVRNQDGGVWLSVTVQEASEGTIRLKSKIHNELYKLGFEDVLVRTVW